MTDPDPAALINAAHGRAHEFFLAQHLAWWQPEAAKKEIDPIALQIAEAGALMRVAAAVAVDAGMDAEAFAAAARESHADAYRRAPKWG